MPKRYSCSRPGTSSELTKRCIADISHCAPEIIARIGYESVRPIVDAYIGYLRNQAGGNYRSFTQNFKNAAQEFYDFDLSQVGYVYNINTVHGQHITIGNEIYFTRTLSTSSYKDLETVLHELEHVGQYQRRGGIEPFMTEYILKSGDSVLEGQSVNVHDNVEIEQAANNKSEQIVDIVWNRLTQQGRPPPPPPVSQATSNICRVWSGGCYLPQQALLGVSCYCNTPSGPIWGAVSQQ